VVYRRSLYAMIFLEFVAFCLGAGTLSKPVWRPSGFICNFVSLPPSFSANWYNYGFSFSWSPTPLSTPHLYIPRWQFTQFKSFMLNLAHFSGMYCIPSTQLATDQYNVLGHKYAVRKQLFSIRTKVCILNTLLWPATSDNLFNINTIRQEVDQYFTIAGPVQWFIQMKVILLKNAQFVSVRTLKDVYSKILIHTYDMNLPHQCIVTA
jgi:hypothetical protein